jgi:hypothetical protein
MFANADSYQPYDQQPGVSGTHHLADIPSWVKPCRPDHPAGKVGEQHHAPVYTDTNPMDLNGNQLSSTTTAHCKVQTNPVQLCTLLRRIRRPTLFASSHLTRSTICINHGLPHRYQHQTLRLSLYASE